MHAPNEIESPRKLTRDEIVAEIHRGAKARRGMTATALIRAYKAGKLDDPGEVSDLLALAGLLAKRDPLFVAP